MATNRPTDFIKTQANEAIKQWITYDGSSRMEFVYVAATNARNGDPCLVTQYTYVGASTRIQGSKEFEGTWNSAWDF